MEFIGVVVFVLLLLATWEIVKSVYIGFRLNAINGEPESAMEIQMDKDKSWDRGEVRARRVAAVKQELADMRKG